ncbi:MAG: hypothetical protein ACW98Y_10830 [Candidatus Thorarchaeota archaeon]|jgi:hypothetical protein
MSNNGYELLSDKELIKQVTEKMGLVKMMIREIQKSLLKIEGS